MYTPDQLREMPGHHFDELLEPMSRRDMRRLLVYLHGYSPEGVAAALNFEERTSARIAEMAALAGREAAKPAPVITDSERTCDQANPVTGVWCHRSGDHTTHRDTDGGTWTTDARLTELAAKS